MSHADVVDTTHRQLAELQRTLTTKATQLEQLSLDISRLVGDDDRTPSPWSSLIDAAFHRTWRDVHRNRIRVLVTALEDQAAHLGDLRRHLLLAADDPAVSAGA